MRKSRPPTRSPRHLRAGSIAAPQERGYPSAMLRATARPWFPLLPLVVASLALPAAALDATVTGIRVSERGSGGFFNLSVTVEGPDAFDVAAVRVGPLSGAVDAPGSVRVPSYTRARIGRAAVPIAGEAIVTVQLRDAAGAPVGGPQRFAVSATQAAPVDDEPRGRDVRLKRWIRSASPAEEDRFLVEGVGSGSVASLVVEFPSERAAAPLEVALAPYRQHYRQVVVFDDLPIGASAEARAWLLDADGAPLGAAHTMRFRVEAARGQ